MASVAHMAKNKKDEILNAEFWLSGRRSTSIMQTISVPKTAQYFQCQRIVSSQGAQV